MGWLSNLFKKKKYTKCSDSSATLMLCDIHVSENLKKLKMGFDSYYFYKNGALYKSKSLLYSGNEKLCAPSYVETSLWLEKRYGVSIEVHPETHEVLVNDRPVAYMGTFTYYEVIQMTLKYITNNLVEYGTIFGKQGA